MGEATRATPQRQRAYSDNKERGQVIGARNFGKPKEATSARDYGELWPMLGHHCPQVQTWPSTDLNHPVMGELYVGVRGGSSIDWLL